MRYTRNRQIGKAMKDSWKGMKNNPIKTNPANELDKNFMWIRFDSCYKGRMKNYYTFKGQMYARKIK